MGHPEFKGRAWLVKNGVALETAFTMDPVWADALILSFGEMNGQRWNWNSRSWEDPK